MTDRLLCLSLAVMSAVSPAPYFNGEAKAATKDHPPVEAAPQLRDQAAFEKLFAGWVKTRGRTKQVSARNLSDLNSAIPAPHLPEAPGRITSNFGMRTNPIVGRTMMHSGADLAAPAGTPVRATASGMVIKAQPFGSYGLYVQLDHGAGVETRYGHMSRLNVFSGQQVRKGDVIGYVGSTGRSTGNHLHYEVRRNGNALDPRAFMRP